MRTIITGAHGVVGTAITQNSSRDYDLLDITDAPSELPDGTAHPHAGRETIIADVSNIDSLVDVFEPYDSIVHLAGNSSPESDYQSVERNNVRGTYNALEAARRTGIENFVFASSNHVVGMYEKEHSPDLYGAEYQLSVDHESPIRPDSHYGSSKAAGEAWGRQYAENHNINFYALRIGSVRPPTWDHPYGDAERGVDEGEWERGNQAYERMVARLKCTWQSRQDLAHLVEQCLDDEQVSFGIFYGISDNSNSWFELDNARERIGYTPRDSADDPRWDKEYETGP